MVLALSVIGKLFYDNLEILFRFSLLPYSQIKGGSDPIIFNLLHKEIGHINPHVLYVFHSGTLLAVFTRNQLALRFLTHSSLTTHYP